MIILNGVSVTDRLGIFFSLKGHRGTSRNLIVFYGKQ